MALKKGPFDGVKAVVEMLNLLDQEHRERLMKTVAQQNPELAEKIRSSLVNLESLLTLSERSFQTLIREAGTSKLALALRSATDEFKTRVMQGLPARARQLLEEEMKEMGPRFKREVDQAQKEIVKLADTLRRSGKIKD